MTTPAERTNTVIAAHAFLQRLAAPYGAGIKKIPAAVRAEARQLLRHYPRPQDLLRASQWNISTVVDHYEKFAGRPLNLDEPPA